MKRRRRRKRCPYCGELFWPDGRTAWRQWACSKAWCQAKRRQDTQRRQRLNNVGEGQARRYRAAIAAAKDGSCGEVSMPRTGRIFRSLVWGEMKDEIEPQLFVTLVFFAKLLFDAARDEKKSQDTENMYKIVNYRTEGLKDEIAGDGPPP